MTTHHPMTTRKRKADGILASQAPELISRKRRPYAKTFKRAMHTYKKAEVEDVVDEDVEIPQRGAIGQEPIIMEVIA